MKTIERVLNGKNNRENAAIWIPALISGLLTLIGIYGFGDYGDNAISGNTRFYWISVNAYHVLPTLSDPKGML